MAVDSKDIISIGDELLERYPDEFIQDYEQNRQAVEALTDLRSRRVCNRVAGYITRNRSASGR